MRYLLTLVFVFHGLAVHAGPDDRLTVFVSIPPQKFLVDRIGGERVQTSVMLKPGQSPETYDPTPKQIAMLSTARIYFRIGVPFEQHWMKMMMAQNRKMLVVDCCAALVRNQDLHTWTDPNNAKVLASQIRDVLSDQDQEGSTLYSANYHLLIADLDQLDLDIGELLSQRSTDYFIVSHASWGYYAERYGLRQLALESYGRERGPRGLTDLVEMARQEGIRTVFVQQQHPVRTAQTLARELNGEVKVLDPLAEDYIANLYVVTRLIAEAVR